MFWCLLYVCNDDDIKYLLLNGNACVIVRIKWLRHICGMLMKLKFELFRLLIMLLSYSLLDVSVCAS